MGRPKKRRFVAINPEITYYKPRGVPLSALKKVILTIDELEAIRLKNLQGLTQRKAAKKMKISTSTFQRIINSSHQKIAIALLTGQAIIIQPH